MAKKKAEAVFEEIAKQVDEIDQEQKLRRLNNAKRDTDQKYKLLQERLIELETELAAAIDLKESFSTYEIKAPKKNEPGEATAVALASDWHVEERVDSKTVNGMNEFTLKIAERRIHLFFVNLAKLIGYKQKAIKIRTLMLGLLGDFISGYIHEELVEMAQLPPIEAAIWAQNQIASGIDYLLANTDVNIVATCHSGNHGRTTRKVRFATERGNSLEYFMYYVLADRFRGGERVTFMVSPGYHSFANVAGFRIRFHHGHAIRYQGGVGGVYIPVNKAIAQWNKSNTVDADCFGHFHQLRYGGNFILNGSLIGMNAFAVSIKADYEKPKQAFFLVNHRRREITDFSPVWLD